MANRPRALVTAPLITSSPWLCAVITPVLLQLELLIVNVEPAPSTSNVPLVLPLPFSVIVPALEAANEPLLLHESPDVVSWFMEPEPLTSQVPALLMFSFPVTFSAPPLTTCTVP